MSVVETKYTIAKLNGYNYFLWRYKIEMLLKDKGIWYIIRDPAPSPVTDKWTTDNDKAQSSIVFHIEDNQIQHVRNATSAQAAWTALKDIHEKDSPSNRVHILRKIMSKKCNEGENIEAFVNNLNELFQQLMALGDEIKPEFFLSATLLAALPESYDSLITALESRTEAALTSSLVISKVLSEYKRRVDRNGADDDNKVLKMQHKNKGKSSCYFCKKPGHEKKECRKFAAWQQKKNNEGGHKANVLQTNESNQFLFVVSTLVSGWILDSGATCHISGQRNAFSPFNANHREIVTMANGSHVTAMGKGDIRIQLLNESNETTLVTMKDVLYIPGVNTNLVSVKKLTENGLSINFDHRKCLILKNTKQIAIGDASGSLYKLREPQVYAVSQSETECAHHWHSVLGHRDIEIIKSLSSSGLVKGIEITKCSSQCSEKDKNCGVCMQGKLTRVKIPTHSVNRSQAILDLVHTDVCGPMQTVTPSGKKYILTFIDDYSRFTAVYHLSQKSDTFSKFKEFVEMSKNMFGRKPVMIRSDRGGEHTSKDFKRYMKQEGIQVQRTAPHMPFLNGIAERKNRTLVEMARCMLLDSGLENKFWGEAVLMANHIQNRLPAKGVGKTPFQEWCGRKPSIKHFKPFGAQCFIGVPAVQRRKLDVKAVAAILVGYKLLKTS